MKYPLAPRVRALAVAVAVTLSLAPSCDEPISYDMVKVSYPLAKGGYSEPHSFMRPSSEPVAKFVARMEAMLAVFAYMEHVRAAYGWEDRLLVTQQQPGETAEEWQLRHEWLVNGVESGGEAGE